MLNASVVPASGSVAVTVCTGVEFSGTDAAAPLVMLGASLTLVTVTSTVLVSWSAPSLARTCTSYTLFAPTSVGVSKSGAALNASAPVLLLMLNLAWSAPPTILNANVDPASGSVAVTVCTAVVFSGTDDAAALVMLGAS